MDPLLQARGLYRAFDANVAVEDVSLTVNGGEIVGFLGANGAGKTTTLRMLAGILEPHGGDVHVCGTDMQRDPLVAKARMGFLSGDTHLYPRLSAREIFRYFGSLYGVEKKRLEQRIETVVKELAMEEYADRPASTLSAGQKQRANIGRAFLHDPEVLILDEPTNALDVLSGRFIVESLRKQRDRGRAILFSTHIMSEAEYLCDRIYMVHKGRVVAEGTPKEIIEHAGQTNLTDAFLYFVEKHA